MTAPGGETERDLFRRLFDAMPQLGWTAQPDGFVEYYNRGWYEFTGSTLEAMRGWGWTSVHHPDELARVIESWSGSIATGKPWEIEFPLRRHDGVYRWFLSRATPIFDDAGTLLRWVGINTDIDDKKRAERQLAELAQAKTTFFNNVSHELRTPLTLILGPLEDAANAESKSLTGPALETARRNAARLLKLVNTLLDFARFEEDRAEASFVEADLGAFTRELASAFDSALEAAGLAFSVDIDPALPRAFVDPVMWEKVVLNLLSNALKFTLEGEIAISLRAVENAVVLQVRDTGTGIAAEELPRVFERFHRVAGAPSRTHEGTGIGLSLVREVVRLHGGEVAITSALGEGTVVRVDIPLGSAHLPKSAVSRVRRVPASSAPPPRSMAQLFLDEAKSWLPSDAGQTTTDVIGASSASATSDEVLVADDNADMREYLGRLLAPRWKVRSASDGVEALALAKAFPPALLLTDAMMPNQDGFALLRAFRSDEALRTIPVLMLSARAGESARIEGLELGADDYLVKPFAGRELVARVGALIQASKLRALAENERENFRQLILQSPVPVALFSGPEHRIVEVSPTYLELAPGRALLGKTIREAFEELPADHPMFTALDRVGAGRETVRVDELAIPRLTGRGGNPDVRWINYVARPIQSAAGVIGTMAIAIDVTSQVLARIAVEDARREAERFQTILATAQRVARIGVFDWEVSSNQMYWSPELFALMGLVPGAIEPSPDAWTARVHPDDALAGWQEFVTATDARQPVNESEQRILLPSGDARWMRITNHIVYGADGKPTRVIGTMIDIQNLRELAAREKAARVEAEEANHAKDDFIAMLGHELRNPLAPILTAVQLMRGRGAERVAREIDVIERQARHLVRLVDDLLDVSRIARGKVDLTRETVEIADVIAAAIETASPVIETGRHEVQLDVPKLGLAVDVDRFRMCQMIANLLTNAAKYTPPGGRITVRASLRGETVAVEVRDTGSGIAAELLPRVFDLFVQSRQTIERSQGGLGLGLSIVKSLVALHGGTVVAESGGAGEGSCFTVVLPTAREATTSATTAARDVPSLEGKQRRMLVVDDNEDAAEMLGAAMEMLGYKTALAGNGPDALRIAKDFYPHVALLDIGLPVMDGYELAKKLRREHGSGLMIVAITGYGQESDRVRSMDAGFNEHLTKPVDLAKLAKLLGRNAA